MALFNLPSSQILDVYALVSFHFHNHYITLRTRSYILFVTRFHSLHHTQFRTNYSLFMPLYDYIHGTTDRSSDALYESSLERQQESPDVVHLTHLTTPESIFHLRVGFASFASRPQEWKWSTWFMWPLSWLSVMLNFFYGGTFLVERNLLGKLKLQTWTVPRYSIQVNACHVVCFC